MTRLIVKASLIILLIAAVAATLIFTTIMLNKEGKTDASVLNVAGKQRMLSQGAVKETFHLLSNPAINRTELDRIVKEFELNQGDLMRGNAGRHLYMPPTTKVADALDEAEHAWGGVRQMIETLEQKQRQIALETENFLQMVPQLQEATEEVAFIVERRRMSRTVQQETRAQSGVLNLVVLMASAYLASGQESYYEEFRNALANYDTVLSTLANHDGFLHGSVLALVSDNQLLWDAFHDSIVKSVEGKRTLLVLQEEMAQKSETLLAALEVATMAYAEHSEENRLWLERLQYIFAFLLLAVVIYSLYVVWGMRTHIRHFIDHSKALADTRLEQKDTPEPFGFEESDEEELKEAGGHINRFVAKVEQLMHRSAHLQDLSEAMAEELARLSGEIDHEINANAAQVTSQSSDEMRRTVKLLGNLKNTLDDLRRNADIPTEDRE